MTNDEEVLTGTVTAWKELGGNGFIRPATAKYGDKEVFCHRNNCGGRQFLSVGARVRFKLRVSDRGPYAIDVMPWQSVGQWA